jgi:hypothetical protein
MPGPAERAIIVRRANGMNSGNALGSPPASVSERPFDMLFREARNENSFSHLGT